MKAIILAAGIGSRLQPMTLNKPKPLLEIRGKSILENMIEHLKKDGFDNVIVVSGYKSELFYPLRDRLHFKHIIYEDFNNKNSSASLKYVIDEIEQGTLIINGDLFITNSFASNLKRGVSCVVAQKILNKSISWGYLTDENCKLIHIDTNATNGYGDGIAFFDNKNDIKVIKDSLLNCSDDEYWEYCYLRAMNKIDIYVFNQDSIYIEIDSFYDAISNFLLTPEEIAIQISDDNHISRLGGITNTNYKIKFQGKDKVIRIPSPKMSNFIDREVEYRVLDILSSDITPNSNIYSSDIKITDFLYGYNNLIIKDLDNKEIIFPLIVARMHQIHSIKYNSSFGIKLVPILDEIKKYENLVSIKLVSKIEQNFIYYIARKLDKDSYVLCHRDLQLPNIMFNGSDIKFIDFEYAGFTSIKWELGNFSAELQLNKEAIMYLLSIYNQSLDETNKLSYCDIKEGELVSNYVWALWSWGNNYISLGREYLIRLHSNISEFNLNDQ